MDPPRSPLPAWLGVELEVLPEGTIIKQVVPEGRIVGKLGSGGAPEYPHRDSPASSKLLTHTASGRIQDLAIGERGDPDTKLIFLSARSLRRRCGSRV